jgi:hypothetical protein
MAEILAELDATDGAQRDRLTEVVSMLTELFQKGCEERDGHR